MGLIRKRFYAPDGKPPTNYAEGREFTVIRQLRKKGISLDAIAGWIEGTAAIRDDDGLVTGELGHVDWLHKGDKLTMRALYNTRSGVMPVCQLAEIKLAERDKAAGQGRSTFANGRIQISLSPKAS